MATSHPQTENSITVTVEVDGTEPVVSANTDGQALGVPIDVAFDAVRSERRRMALSTLASVGGTIDISDLTDAIAGQQYGDPDPQERKRVYVGLYQTHLPKLDDMGLVKFDSDTGEVYATDDLAGVVAWLDDTRARCGGDA